MLEEQFSPAGVHLEHSPDYHRMVFDTFNGILEADLTKQKRIWELRDRVEASLAWFVMPNGFLANFGDTDRRKMFKDNLDESEYQVEAMKFVKSRGVKGEPPQETMRAFEDSGYFIARDRWSNGTKDFEQCSYLAQICGFHSRTHKHADDLSFIWYDRAQISYFYNNMEEISLLGQNARQWVVQYRSWEITTSRLLQLYRSREN
jgi:hypothetical protein